MREKIPCNKHIWRGNEVEGILGMLADLAG